MAVVGTNDQAPSQFPSLTSAPPIPPLSQPPVPKRRPATPRSPRERPSNGAKFHTVSHLMMAPPENPGASQRDMIKCVIIRDKKSTFKSM